jgi:putative oxidoreductase
MLAKVFAKGSDWAGLPLRLALAAVFIGYGGQKLFGVFGGHGLPATISSFDKMGFHPAMFWATLVAIVEFFGGVCLGVGFLTRWAALALAVNMAVAVLKVHLPNGLFLPNGFEYPLVLCAAALALVLVGPGKVSLDNALKTDR